MSSDNDHSDGTPANSSPGDGSRRARIERALREMPLSEEQIAAAATILADDLVLSNGKVRDDSSLFDFRRKVDAVVTHFCNHGLTQAEYLRAAVKQPQLFSQSPATIIANIEGVVDRDRFRECGLTQRDYLRAAAKQPTLFAMTPDTVIHHIETVAAHFEGHGLTLRDYLRVAVKSQGKRIKFNHNEG